MNLWRVAVDQSTGAVTGEPEPVTNGVQASAALPRFSADGKRLAFRSRVKSVNPVAIPFDPVALRAGVPVVLDGSNNIRVPSDASPDGRQLAYFSIGERQEDVFISAADGRGMRRLTDDAVRDRAPMFTRDGKAVVFYSARDGNWALWMVRVDGGGLRKVTTCPQGCTYGLPSPADDTIVASSGVGGSVYLVRPSGDGYTAPESLPDPSTPRGTFLPTSVSPDGRRIGGIIVSPGGRAVGTAVYELSAHHSTEVSTDETFAVRWLPDGRHLVYFTNNRTQLVAVDTVTRQRTLVDARLPGPSIDDVFGLSADGRIIYYGWMRAEADIWIAERR
jgi:Tol biopolymer transport system component